jgi:hypothetical protein
MPDTDTLIESDLAQTPDAETYGLDDEALLEQAQRRFKQALESVRDDFDTCERVQAFIANDQWPANIKSTREGLDRPCLTLDHLNQYVRHVVNSGLLRKVDIRVMPMDGTGDDATAAVIAGMVRQIVQTSTARVAYETGLRHECQNGFGYWRVKVTECPCPEAEGPTHEIAIRRIPDPRMVLLDPFCEYPDGRDARFGFILTKLATADYREQYNVDAGDEVSSWQMIDGKEVMPWLGASAEAVVVAEYFYLMKDGAMCWAVLSPTKVLAKGVHHGDLMPIIRCVGDEYEHDGKQRRRGMIEPAMDAQRAYNYASSALIENAALAPIAPYIAADGQIEQYANEWKDAHRVPRAVLRYKPISVGGQPVPPPQRVEPAGMPAGWQGMLGNLVQDTQHIMGLAQPAVLGSGGTGQTGAAITAQQAPGDTNTFHFHEHWFEAIEQTGRVIMAMIPHVYTVPQVIKIMGDDGVLGTALLDPMQQQASMEKMDAVGKVMSQSYNPCLGRYDVVISLGPASATKKEAANKMAMTMVNAAPQLLPVIGDLLFATMDIPGADQIAARLRAQSGQPTPEQLQAVQVQIAQLTKENQDLQQLVLAEQQKAIASMENAKLDQATTLTKANLDAQVKLEIATRDNLNALLLERMKGHVKISTEVIKLITNAAGADTHEARMMGYGEALQDLTADEMQPVQ